MGSFVIIIMWLVGWWGVGCSTDLWMCVCVMYTLETCDVICALGVG